MLLTLIALIVVIVATVYFYKKTKSLENMKQLPPGFQSAGDFQPVTEVSGERSIKNLQIGDIVTHFDQDFVVEGRIDYNDSGWPWTCFMLVDGDDVRWLAVEEDDQLEVSIWRETDVVIQGSVPEFIEFEGEKFRMVERGKARVSQMGQTGTRRGMEMEYYEFEGQGDRYLSVEKWGQDIEVSVGEDVNPYALEILPGGGTSFT